MKPLMFMLKNRKATLRKILVSLFLNSILFILFNYENVNNYNLSIELTNELPTINNYLYYFLTYGCIFIALLMNQYKYEKEIIHTTSKFKDYLYAILYGFICYIIGSLFSDLLIFVFNAFYLKEGYAFIILPMVYSLLLSLLYSLIISLILISNHYSLNNESYGMIYLTQFILALFMYLIIDKSSILFLSFIIIFISCLSILSFFTTKIFLYGLKSRNNKAYIIDKFTRKKFNTYFTFIYYISLTIFIILYETSISYANNETSVLSFVLSITLAIIGLISICVIYYINKNNYIEANENVMTILENMNVQKRNIYQLMDNSILMSFIVSTVLVFASGFLVLYYIKTNVTDLVFSHFIDFTYSEYIIFAIIYLVIFFLIINLDFPRLNKMVDKGEKDE